MKNTKQKQRGDTWGDSYANKENKFSMKNPKSHKISILKCI